MGHIDSSGSEFDIDLESGGTTSEEDESKDEGLSDHHSRKLLGRTCSGSAGLHGSRTGVHYLSSYNEALSSAPNTVANSEIFSEKLEDDMVNFLEKKMTKVKRPNSKKAPKPPRPPKGPSMGTADLKLVKEISELAMLKRKRIERMKALKGMKTEKASSFNSNLFAMVVTILFFFVIISQGLLGSRV